MKKLRAWLDRRKSGGDKEPRLFGPRREFIYLDDVSVYSLIASRLGSIPEQLTRSASVALQDELSSSIGVAVGLKSDVGARSSTTTTSATQVVRKSLVQGAFKELLETEEGDFAIRDPGGDESPPAVSGVADFERLANSGGSSWLVDPKSLKRGQLLELGIELAADPIFAFNTAVSSMVEIMDENPELFGTELEGIAAGDMMVRILDRLLAGLVPLRCRVVNYHSVTVDNRELLVHRRLIDPSDSARRTEIRDVHLVGVAEKDLFWKDLRRVLFSQAHVTVMCRLGRDGLQRTWSPVKLADVFKQVLPQVADQLDVASVQIMAGFRGAAAGLTRSEGDSRMRLGLRLYAAAYATHHGGGDFDIEQLDDLLEPEPGIEYERTDARREAVRPLTERLRELFDQPANTKLEAALRSEAMETAGFGFGDREESTSAQASPVSVAEGRFLDAEIVAIYW